MLTAVLSQDVPISGAFVTASIERPSGATESFGVLDDGVAPDVLADDGIYSAVLSYEEDGINAVIVHFDNSAGTAELTELSFASAIGEDGPVPLPDPSR